MSLYPSCTPGWPVAPLWEVLLSRQLRAVLMGCHLPPSRWAFAALCTQLMPLDPRSFSSPNPSASISMAFSLCSMREASFGILPCQTASLRSEPFMGLGYPHVGGYRAMASAVSGDCVVAHRPARIPLGLGSNPGLQF